MELQLAELKVASIHQEPATSNVPSILPSRSAISIRAFHPQRPSFKNNIAKTFISDCFLMSK